MHHLAEGGRGRPERGDAQPHAVGDLPALDARGGVGVADRPQLFDQGGQVNAAMQVRGAAGGPDGDQALVVEAGGGAGGQRDLLGAGGVLLHAQIEQRQIGRAPIGALGQPEGGHSIGHHLCTVDADHGTLPAFSGAVF